MTSDPYVFYRGVPRALASEGAPALEKGYRMETWKPGVFQWKPRGLLLKPMLPWWLFRLLGVFRSPGYRIILIYAQNGEVAHYSVVLPAHFKTPFMEPGDLQIGPVGTDERHRRKGLASAAIREILSQFRDRNAALWYIARADNEASRKVIEKIGFQLFADGVKKKRPGFGFFDVFVVTRPYGKTNP